MAIAVHSQPAEVETIVGLICQSIEYSHEQRWPEALDCLDRGLRIAPDFFPCRLARARVLARMERFVAALADLNQVAAHVKLPDASAEFARVFGAAMSHVEARLAAAPDDAAAYFLRGEVYVQARHPVAALAEFDRALGGEVDAVALHMARGNVLCELGRLSEAVAAYERIIALDGANALAWYNRGNVLQRDCRLREAVASYERAVGLAPRFAEAWLELAHCRLACGELEQGWQLYEWRWQTTQLAAAQLVSERPRWLGQEALAGKTILLWAEQGYGDTIQFARFIPRVADLAARVVVRVPAALRALLATLDPRIGIVTDDAPLPEYDYHCPLMSLPLALGDTCAHAWLPYLRADGAQRRLWQSRLVQDGRPRIGLCWAGRHGAAGAGNPTRDAPLAAWLALAAVDAQFICLQQDYTEADEESLARWPACRPVRHGFDSFADTAALIAELDLVISVDTAVAHLAGALGKPCWLVLRRCGEWRWRQHGDSTAWYPSMRIFRQAVDGDWQPVLHVVASALAHHRHADASRSHSGIGVAGWADGLPPRDGVFCVAQT
jgi:tetratricopeptide (TPR) repeat protein